jgi:hypothetical protein
VITKSQEWTMGRLVDRIERHRRGQKRLRDLLSHPGGVIVVHYSCESFYDRPDGSSPRITSIAARNLESGQTTSFSIHQVAERRHYSNEQLEQHYDELERLMLDEFYVYVAKHPSHVWLHWNMRDINYGFPAIGHRYRVLGGEPVEIHESCLVDLARLLVDTYGRGYMRHPRLPSLVATNKISNLGFLTGEEEAFAFEQRDYVKLHQSTLRKVDVIANIAERANDGSLRTEARWADIYGLTPTAILEFVKENPLVSALAAIASIAGLVLSVITLLR